MCWTTFLVLICHLYVIMVKYMYMSFVHFLITLFMCFFLNAEFFESSFYILDAILLSDMCFANIFSQSVTHLFIFLMGFFAEQNFKILIKCKCSALCFMAILRSLCPGLDHEDLLQFFFSKIFIMLHFILCFIPNNIIFSIFSKYFMQIYGKKSSWGVRSHT